MVCKGDNMKKQRDPEKTKFEILDAAEKLFLEKGYDKTTIADIVGEIGMTKGAIYHHFKSKMDILESLFYYRATRNLENYKTGKNALEDLRNLFGISLQSHNTQAIVYSASLSLKSPEIVGKQFFETLESADEIAAIIERGVVDGSINTKYPKEVSELILIYLNMRIGIFFDDFTKEEFMRKIYFTKDMLEGLGVPVFNEKVLKDAEDLFDFIKSKKMIK